MKTQWIVLSILALSAGLTSCISSSETVFSKPWGIDKQASYKVTAVNTEDIVLGKLESYLQEQGFRLISNHQIRTPQISDYVTIATHDTTFQNPRYNWVSLELFDYQPSDYIIKYQYQAKNSITRLVLTDFNASVVDVKTGTPIATYSFRQSRMGIGKKRGEKVLKDLVRRMSEGG